MVEWWLWCSIVRSSQKAYKKRKKKRLRRDREKKEAEQSKVDHGCSWSWFSLISFGLSLISTEKERCGTKHVMAWQDKGGINLCNFTGMLYVLRSIIAQAQCGSEIPQSEVDVKGKKRWDEIHLSSVGIGSEQDGGNGKWEMGKLGYTCKQRHILPKPQKNTKKNN
ncbi:hypothetical protein BD289DRAFT_442104 [Coniella lustricola]|uniref:Uncharacterized protein n=1 Tax=Coniella lustricola TaxID=2025994 RepID=A0A2T2ZYK7_9PEZI|nr:hypothetical protein BD289DRAFT_442104 [Coniella lustricola]